MNPKYVLSALALALAFVPAAAAQKPKAPAPPTPVTPPTKNAITLSAKPSTIVFSGVTTLSGRLSGPKSGSVGLRLWQDTTRPYGDAYRPSSITATTDKNGRYSFAAKPLVNTSYRVVASTTPPVTSAARLVLVRIKVGINLSDRTRGAAPSCASTARCSPRTTGAWPRSSGAPAAGASGPSSVRSCARKRGSAKSTYSRRVRIYRDGVYRVKVAATATASTGSAA